MELLHWSKLKEDILKLLHSRGDFTLKEIVTYMESKGYNKIITIYVLAMLYILGLIKLNPPKKHVAEIKSFPQYLKSSKSLWLYLAVITPILTFTPITALKVIGGIVTSYYIVGYLILRVLGLHRRIPVYLQVPLSITVSVAFSIVLGLMLNYTLNISVITINIVVLSTIYTSLVVAVVREYSELKTT